MARGMQSTSNNGDTMAKAFMVACKEYFGVMPGQSLMEFKREVDGLTPADREQMAPALSAHFGEPVDTGIKKPE